MSSSTQEEALSASITKAASKQTYYTVRLLVDRSRAADAYRAYAYFRWVDDQIDERMAMEAERRAFLARQQVLIDCGYHGQLTVGERSGLTPEEAMLAELIRHDTTPDSGLQAYIRNMIAVMAFDAERRGRLISAGELSSYSHHLAIAVTEALHYFIGHDQPSPRGETRYLAVTAAHITHLLRDTFEDVGAGYYNIPAQYLKAHRLEPDALDHPAYREWTRSRVRLAREYFRAGRAYVKQVGSFRCRLAGYAYTARFENVLRLIERDDYHLRPNYPERKSLNAGLRIGWAVLAGAAGLIPISYNS